MTTPPWNQRTFPSRGRRAPAAARALLAATLPACSPEAAEDSGGLLRHGPEGGTGAAAARADRPIIQQLQVGDGSGWAPERRTSVMVDAKGTPAIDAVCVTTSRRCTAWAPVADSYALTLPVGGGPHTVRAWVRNTDGLISAVAQATVQVDARPPVDGALAATPEPGAIQLSWSGFSDRGSGVDHYVLVGENSSIVPRCSDTGGLRWTGTGSSARFEGLGPGTYAFRLCAVDRFGRSSAGATLRTTAAPDTTPPVITSVSVVGDSAWSAARPIEVEVAVTDASAVPDLCFAEGSTCGAWQPMRSPAPTTLSPGSGPKTLNVWAKDAWGNISAPAVLETGLDNTPPTAGSLSATAGPSEVRLSWSGFSDAQSGIGLYRIYRDYDRAPASCGAGTLIYEGSGSSTTDAGLLSGQRYAYRICAEDRVGNAHSGETANATPLAELEAPTLRSLRLAGGAPAVSDRFITVEIDAVDVNGVSRMCISNTPTCGTWRSFQASSNWTLDSGAYGARVVYLWLEDSLGNRTTAAASASIRYGADADRDGYADGWDCDDADPRTYPGAAPACGADHDCDGYDDDDQDDDGLTSMACGGEDCDDEDPLANASTCPQGESCLDILEAGRSVGSGLYRIDPDGWGGGAPTEAVLCEMVAHGGGWTLLFTNRSSWPIADMVTASTVGSASLTANYRGAVWSTLPFTDLMFEDGLNDAVYEGVGDGSESYLDFQSRIPEPDCTRTSGLTWPMTAGNLAGGRLCDTNLYINPHDQDGGGLCTLAREHSNYALGPTWSANNNNGCPLDDPSGTSFASHTTSVAVWRAPMRMWAR